MQDETRDMLLIAIASSLAVMLRSVDTDLATKLYDLTQYAMNELESE